MEATRLSPELVNGIGREIERATANFEIVFGKVTKRDDTKKVIWLEQYGDLAIPLVSFVTGFSYYDTDASGYLQLRRDPTGENAAFQTTIITPRVGQMAVILDPGGQHRFPLCVGVIQSTGYWQGEA